MKLVAGVFAAAALAALLLALLTSLGGWPLASGRWLVGEQAMWGPAALVLFAAFAGAAALGLWRMRNWGRRLGALLAAVGIALLVPGMMSAVADARLLPILRVGVGVLARVMVLQYLWRPDVREAFAR